MEAEWATSLNDLHIEFKDPSLLEQAFVHRSYLHEHPEFVLPSNERLQFLGDAVLNLAVAERLYQQSAALSEGEMTKIRAALVSQESLAQIAFSLQLGEHLYLSQGEERGGGRRRPKILACALEALVGAIFIDQGLPAAKDFLWRVLDNKLQRIIEEGLLTDYKTRLQELTQAKQKGIPSYRIVQTMGPDHDKEFVVEVAVEGKVMGKGSGKSKQLAEKEAARIALKKLSSQ
jgi:ribonuclease-3